MITSEVGPRRKTLYVLNERHYDTHTSLAKDVFRALIDTTNDMAEIGRYCETVVEMYADTEGDPIEVLETLEQHPKVHHVEDHWIVAREDLFFREGMSDITADFLCGYMRAAISVGTVCDEEGDSTTVEKILGSSSQPRDLPDGAYKALSEEAEEALESLFLEPLALAEAIDMTLNEHWSWDNVGELALFTREGDGTGYWAYYNLTHLDSWARYLGSAGHWNAAIDERGNWGDLEYIR